MDFETLETLQNFRRNFAYFREILKVWETLKEIWSALKNF